MIRDKRAGFSVIELLVTLSIIIVIFTVVILGQSTYSSKLALSNLADEINLEIAQSRSYSTGVKQFEVGSSNFSISYGNVFSLLPAHTDDAYLFFADRNANDTYDGDWTCTVGGASECLAKTDILRGNYIYEICALRTSGGDQCSLGRVDVSFVRPNTDAVLTFYNSGGVIFVPNNLMGASIELRSPNGLSRKVLVYTTGQISVQ